MDDYEAILTENPIFLGRTKGIGILPLEMAKDLGATGPTIRGSNYAWDIRKVEPYCAYPKFDFDIPVGKNCDVWDRYIVRVREMGESVKIIRQALERLPEGDVREKVPKSLNKMPAGEIYVSTEAPRGELGIYLVSDGTKKPYRVKARSGAYCAVSALPAFATGGLIADLVAIVASIDIVLGEVDR